VRRQLKSYLDAAQISENFTDLSIDDSESVSHYCSTLAGRLAQSHRCSDSRWIIVLDAKKELQNQLHRGNIGKQ